MTHPERTFHVAGCYTLAAAADSTRRRAAAQPPPQPNFLPYLCSCAPRPPPLCPQLANKVDVIFALAQAWCLSESDSDFELLEKRLEALTPDESILVRASITHRCLHHC